MNFVDWMNMSMAVDISFLVFAAATVWKAVSLQKKVQRLDQNVDSLRRDLELTMRNPAAAKRLLKERR